MIHTDFQPYILPNTDNWALPSIKALELLNYLEKRGTKQVICVPPIRKENPENTTGTLKETFNAFKSQYKGKIELRLAAKYRLDDAFEETLANEKLLTINNQKELLVDVHPLQKNNDCEKMLDSVLAAGYIPVIIQPERTRYWGTEDFIKLKEKGCKLMMNLYSFFGYNGDGALNYSRMLIKRKLYNYVFSGMEDTKTMHYSENFNIYENNEVTGLLNKNILQQELSQKSPQLIL